MLQVWPKRVSLDIAGHFRLMISNDIIHRHNGKYEEGFKSFIYASDVLVYLIHSKIKANRKDLIASTGLVILLTLDSNRRIFLARVTLKFDG